MYNNLQKVAKDVFNWKKPYIDFISKKHFTLILRIKLIKTIIINCTGKFCYWHGHFRNTAAAGSGILKNFTKIRERHMCHYLILQNYSGGCFWCGFTGQYGLYTEGLIFVVLQHLEN